EAVADDALAFAEAVEDQPAVVDPGRSRDRPDLGGAVGGDDVDRGAGRALQDRGLGDQDGLGPGHALDEDAGELAREELAGLVGEVGPELRGSGFRTDADVAEIDATLLRDLGPIEELEVDAELVAFGGGDEAGLDVTAQGQEF